MVGNKYAKEKRKQCLLIEQNQSERIGKCIVNEIVSEKIKKVADLHAASNGKVKSSSIQNRKSAEESTPPSCRRRRMTLSINDSDLNKLEKTLKEVSYKSTNISVIKIE